MKWQNSGAKTDHEIYREAKRKARREVAVAKELHIVEFASELDTEEGRGKKECIYNCKANGKGKTGCSWCKLFESL